MHNTNTSNAQSHQYTQVLEFLALLQTEGEVTTLLFRNRQDQGELDVHFVVHDPDQGSLAGRRTFNLNTQFTDANDLLEELWMTHDLHSICHDFSMA